MIVNESLSPNKSINESIETPKSKSSYLTKGSFPNVEAKHLSEKMSGEQK